MKNAWPSLISLFEIPLRAKAGPKISLPFTVLLSFIANLKRSFHEIAGGFSVFFTQEPLA